jgi:hypothetical protein
MELYLYSPYMPPWRGQGQRHLFTDSVAIYVKSAPRNVDVANVAPASQVLTFTVLLIQSRGTGIEVLDGALALPWDFDI